MKGRSGMGTSKYRTSGRATKSPRLRLMEKLDAEKKEHKVKQYPMTTNIKELFNRK